VDPQGVPLEIDALLRALQHETRRLILKLLSEQPRYLYHLSKELGMSEQLLLKHLKFLEEKGLVECFVVPGRRAPPRKYYRLKHPFLHISIFLGDRMFRVEVPEAGVEKPRPEKLASLLDEIERDLRFLEEPSSLADAVRWASDLLEEIDEALKEVEAAESYLMRVRQLVLKKVESASRRPDLPP